MTDSRRPGIVSPVADSARREAARPARPATVDTALAMLLCVLTVLGSLHVAGVSGAGMALGLVASASLSVTRPAPLVPAVAVSVCLFWYLAIGNPGGPALLAGPVAMLLIGYRARRPVVLLAAVSIIVGVGVGRLVGSGSPGVIGSAVPAWALTLGVLGILARVRRERSAEQRRQKQLQREQAVTVERLGIARDLHDSVAHALASINVQSTVAERLFDRDPERARAALAAIRGASSDVLDELGWLLNSLRDSGGEPTDFGAGLDGIGDLADRARADGLVVTVRQTGPEPAAGIPLRIGTAAYRVVQEALSNATRHAGPGTRVEVELAASPSALSITVCDDGGPEADGPRHGLREHPGASTRMGLIGMRERVESTGGGLSEGFRDDAAGFWVHAKWAWDDGDQDDGGPADGAAPVQKRRTR